MNHQPSPPNTLSNLFVNKGNYAVIPAFNPAVREYAVTVPDDVDTVDITPVQTDARAAVKINDMPLTEIGDSKPVALVSGNNGIVIIVISTDLTTAAYHLNIIRGQSVVSSLASLVVNGGSVPVYPVFDPDVYAYTADVLTDTAALSLVTGYTSATVKLNGRPVPGDGGTTAINLVNGANYCIMVVTDSLSGNQQEYHLTINRLASNTFNYPANYPYAYVSN